MIWWINVAPLDPSFHQLRPYGHERVQCNVYMYLLFQLSIGTPTAPLFATQPFLDPSAPYFTQLPSFPLRRLYVGHIPWHVIAPVVLLGTGGLAMIVWYLGSNEFLDAGFPPRAAEAFRISVLGANDWQLQHSSRSGNMALNSQLQMKWTPSITEYWL